MQEQDIKSLLSKVEQLIEFDKKLAEQDKNSFNIFEVLRVETKEELLHSRLICSLLDPQLNEQLSEDFLNLFLNIIGEPNFLNSKSISCITEFHIGEIDINYNEGGSIDILLEDINDSMNRAIIIENKIHARDQRKQLKRYHNFGKKFDDFKLIYLTLYENEASLDSLDGLMIDKDYKNITYKEHIKKWLEECKRVAIDYPNMRQILDQYIKTINKLTNQQMSNYMDNEIMKLLKSGENWDTANYIVNGLESYKNNLFEDGSYACKNIDENKIKEALRKSTNIVLKESEVDIKYQYDDGIEKFKIDIICNKGTNFKFYMVIEWGLPKRKFVKYLTFDNYIWDYHEIEERWAKHRDKQKKLRSRCSPITYEDRENLTEILQNEMIETIKAFEDFKF